MVRGGVVGRGGLSAREPSGEGDTAADQEDDEEDEEEEEPDVNPRKKKRKGNKNPEYDRRWTEENEGVGDKVSDTFTPPPNQLDGEYVQSCTTPYHFFRLFFPESFLSEIVEQSKMYALQNNITRGNLVSDDTVMCVVGGLLLSGYNKLPARRLYWRDSPDTYNALLSDSIRYYLYIYCYYYCCCYYYLFLFLFFRRDTFDAVLASMHFVDNNLLDENDRFAKVRPIFENINRQCKKYCPMGEHQSVDEIMVPYFGPHGDKQVLLFTCNCPQFSGDSL